MTVKEILKRLSESDVTEDEIIAYLGHSYFIVVANALMALGRKMRQDTNLRSDKWLPYLQPLTENDDVKNIELVGGIKTSYLLVSCLWDIGTDKAYEMANQYLNTLSDDDREYIEKFYEEWNIWNKEIY